MLGFPPCARAQRSSRSSRSSLHAWPRRDLLNRATTSRRRTSSTCCTRRRRRSRYVSPTRDAILLVSWVEYPPIAQVAEPFLKLAGVRVEPRTRRKHDTPGGYGIAPCAQTLALVDVADAARDRGRRCRRTAASTASSWSADGKRFAFRNTSQDAVELWVGDAATGAIRRARRRAAEPDARQLAAVDARPEDAAREARARRTPARRRRRRSPPTARASRRPTARRGESSTYETRDTLTNKHDEELFDYYATSQLAFVDARPGAITPLGKPGDRTPTSTPRPTASTSSSTTIHKPYSYVTTYDRLRARRRALGPHRPQGRRTHREAARSPIACRSRACRPARATSSGARPSRRRSSGPRRSTAATGTSRSPRATRS